MGASQSDATASAAAPATNPSAAPPPPSDASVQSLQRRPLLQFSTSQSLGSQSAEAQGTKSGASQQDVSLQQQPAPGNLQGSAQSHDRVSVELEELRRTIEGLASDLKQPLSDDQKGLAHANAGEADHTRDGEVLEPLNDDYKRPYSKLDDYVHETMYHLLCWLASQQQYQILTMGELMFYLKSPYLKQRKKYIFCVERILRSYGLSIYDKKATCNPAELARFFDLVKKRDEQRRYERKRLDADRLKLELQNEMNQGESGPRPTIADKPSLSFEPVTLLSRAAAESAAHRKLTKVATYGGDQSTSSGPISTGTSDGPHPRQLQQSQKPFAHLNASSNAGARRDSNSLSIGHDINVDAEHVHTHMVLPKQPTPVLLPRSHGKPLGKARASVSFSADLNKHKSR